MAGKDNKCEVLQAKSMASRAGILLDESQITKYIEYRQDPTFNQSTDQSLFYLVLTPNERKRFDQHRQQFVAGL